MPAFWELLAYRVDYDRLIGLVGSGDELRRLTPKILKSECAREIELEDDRLDPPGLEAALEEMARGGKALKDEHSTAYRIAIEPLAENLAVKFEGIAGYADRSRMAEAFRAIGLNTLAEAFDDYDFRFPWKKAVAGEEWPWATFLARDALTHASDEITHLVFQADNLNAHRTCWQSKSKKNTIVELQSQSPTQKKKTSPTKQKTKGPKTSTRQKQKTTSSTKQQQRTFALITSKTQVTGSLDDVLASVPTADFESAAMALSPDAPPRIWCAALRTADEERIKSTITKKLKLDEYDEDIVPVAITLINIVKAYADALGKPDKKKPLTSATDHDGVLLYADGEQG
jgi:hypothetical protein